MQIDLYDYKPRLAMGSGEPLPYDLPKTEATVGLENTKLLGAGCRFQVPGRMRPLHERPSAAYRPARRRPLCSASGAG